MSGSASFDLHADLSGLPLRLRGLDHELVGRFRDQWSAFVVPDAPVAPVLDIAVRVGGAPAPDGPMNASPMVTTFDRSRATFRAPEGTLELDASGTGEASLAPAPLAKRFYALVNLLCAGLAHRLPSIGGAVLHGAAVVIEGSAFVLVGASGSGKSTWARLSKAAGADLLSDDIAFVANTPAGVEVLSLPIRAYRAEPLGPGRWPLAALLFPQHGRSAHLEPTDGIAVQARLTANLPFVARNLEADPRLLERLLEIAERTRCYTLTFSRDDSFMDLLRSLIRTS